MVDKCLPTWGRTSSPVPCVLASDAIAIKPYSRLRRVPVTARDSEQADEVNATIQAIIPDPRSDNDTVISHLADWIDPNSSAGDEGQEI
jgi:hypothetical protein